QVRVKANYINAGLGQMKAFLTGGELKPPLRVDSTLGEYLDLVKSDPTSPQMVTDQKTPDVIDAMCSLPAYCRERAEGSSVESLTFIANAGNASDLHTDWSGKPALLYQIFGRKRAILFRPEQWRKLMTIEILGGIRLREFSAQEKLDFVRYA